jgi:hypothetical protein
VRPASRAASRLHRPASTDAGVPVTLAHVHGRDRAGNRQWAIRRGAAGPFVVFGGRLSRAGGARRGISWARAANGYRGVDTNGSGSSPRSAPFELASRTAASTVPATGGRQEPEPARTGRSRNQSVKRNSGKKPIRS